MIRIVSFFILISLFAGCKYVEKQTPDGKPTVYIIGDSTVKNGRGDGSGGLWGWGDPLVQFFDSSKISVENHAAGETSSRTYRTSGHWDDLLRKLQPGDFLLIQFGHNDRLPINEGFSATGSFDGISEKTEEIENRVTGEHEVVHTYGWYLRQYIIEAKEKGAVPVVISPIPENEWQDGKVLRNDTLYGEWAREVANFEEVEFIDLNDKMASAMEEMGEDSVSGNHFYKHDKTHTSAKGAVLAASLIADEVRKSESNYLKNYLLPNPKIHFPVKKNVFLVGGSSVADGQSKLIGWCRPIEKYLDTTRVHIFNHAAPNLSSRSYWTRGMWSRVLNQLQEGDFLIIQFDENVADEIEASDLTSSLPGTGDETLEVTLKNGSTELIHTYGWYLKKMISEAKTKGAKVLVLSHTPTAKWDEAENNDFVWWTRDAAKSEHASFIDLTNAINVEYEALGNRTVRQFFDGKNRYTNERGAKLNALILAREIKAMDSFPLAGYIEFWRNR